MAQIWFNDLEDCYIEVSDDMKGEKVKKIIDDLYKDWIDKHPEIFNDFKPVFVDDNGIIDLHIESSFEDDEYSLAFVSQGVSNHRISWGWQLYAMADNDIIKSFTNDLLKRLGQDSLLYFSYQVIADDGWENCSIEVKPNFNNDFPDVEDSAYFYYDYGRCEICDEDLQEEDEEICDWCKKKKKDDDKSEDCV